MAPGDRPKWRPWLATVAAAVPTILVMCLLTVGAQGRAAVFMPPVIAAAAVAASVWAVLRTRRHHRVYEDRLTGWAAERAASAERLRIARELHDLVSHGLGLVTVRAATAARLTGPAADRERVTALTDIEQVSRQTTAELRRMLGVLRAPGGEPASLRPPDRLDNLPAIVREAGAASGLTAGLDLAEVGEVPPGMQVAVCAIVREALTNTARHAGPTRVAIGVRRERDEVVVEIHDGGPAAGWRSRPGAGHGLAGLRERVAALGGTLHAGPTGEGFQVTARLPDRQPG